MRIIKKVAFHTLGCKVNQYETNAMMQQFITAGYEIAAFEDLADIYIINTCTVTNMSDRKSRQMLRRAKQKNPDAIIVATGCYAQVAKEELEKMNEIDLVLGINEKNKIVEYIENYIHDKKKLMKVSDLMMQKSFLDFGNVTYAKKTRAVVKVQDGCDRFCTYCIIPYARGRVRSRKLESIIEEVKELVKNGIKEVVITGIHVASYGKDLEGDISLWNLLNEINKIENLKRIRLSSLEPTLITDEFAEKIKSLDKLCNHFHLSLQSGCDDTLLRMNRKYTTNEFKEVVDRLRKQFKDVILTTDIIVGFPGETDKEFETTYNYLKEIKFYKMHVFPYSQRKGTKAAIMPNQVNNQTKEDRSKKLIELSNKNEEEYLEQYIGKELEVLFEQVDGDYIKGHSKNYLEIKVPKEEAQINDIKCVNIVKRDRLELIGVTKM